MTKNFIMKYVMESTGGMNDMAKSFVDSTMREIRLSFRVKDIGTQKRKPKKIHYTKLSLRYFRKINIKSVLPDQALFSLKETSIYSVICFLL